MKLQFIILLTFALAIAIFGVTELTGCSTNTPNALDVSSFGTEQFECVQNADAAPAADECRAASKARFCARFPTLPDCYPDGGK